MRAREVVWTEEALQQINNVVEYLLANWSEKEVDALTVALQEFEFNVKKYPMMYQAVGRGSKYRRALILTKLSAIYSVGSRQIIVLAVHDNRQDPDKLSRFG